MRITVDEGVQMGGGKPVEKRIASIFRKKWESRRDDGRLNFLR